MLRYSPWHDELDSLVTPSLLHCIMLASLTSILTLPPCHADLPLATLPLPCPTVVILLAWPRPPHIKLASLASPPTCLATLASLAYPGPCRLCLIDITTTPHFAVIILLAMSLPHLAMTALSLTRTPRCIGIDLSAMLMPHCRCSPCLRRLPFALPYSPHCQCFHLHNNKPPHTTPPSCQKTKHSKPFVASCLCPPGCCVCLYFLVELQTGMQKGGLIGQTKVAG